MSGNRRRADMLKLMGAASRSVTTARAARAELGAELGAAVAQQVLVHDHGGGRLGLVFDEVHNLPGLADRDAVAQRLGAFQNVAPPIQSISAGFIYALRVQSIRFGGIGPGGVQGAGYVRGTAHFFCLRTC